MAVEEVKVPDIGDFDDVEIIEVLVAPGDRIELEQSLITLESDKASMEVPSTAAGVVQALRVGVGDRVSAGVVVLTVEADTAAVGEGGEAAPPLSAEQRAPGAADSGASDSGAAARGSSADAAAAEADPVHHGTRAQDSAAAPQPADPPPAASSSAAADSGAPAAKPAGGGAAIDRDGHRAAHAGPAVRRFARQLGVDLSHVDGSGPKGRIRHQDVEAYVKTVLTGSAAPPPAAGGGGALPPIPEVDFSKFGAVEEVALTRIQRLSGPHLHRSWVNIPHVTQHDLADITELEAFRKAMKGEAESQGLKLTPLAFLVKVVAAVLGEQPRFNASLAPDGQSLIVKKYCHIGVAVDTPDGLVVPVLRDADRKGIFAIAADLDALSAKARAGKLTPGDMQGGCFTISSLGGIGGTAFTPVVNAPEVAILGVSRSRTEPVWNGEAFAPRLLLPLSLSYDHRVIDGAMAARFTTRLGQLLSDLRRLAL